MAAEAQLVAQWLSEGIAEHLKGNYWGSCCAMPPNKLLQATRETRAPEQWRWIS